MAYRHWRSFFPPNTPAACSELEDHTELQLKRGRVTPDLLASLCVTFAGNAVPRVPCRLAASSNQQLITFHSETHRRREGVDLQDGGAVGSRRGDVNCVQYGFFPHGYTRRGK